MTEKLYEGISVSDLFSSGYRALYSSLKEEIGAAFLVIEDKILTLKLYFQGTPPESLIDYANEALTELEVDLEREVREGKLNSVQLQIVTDASGPLKGEGLCVFLRFGWSVYNW